ncbi:MAG: acyltransferase family protein [Lachnospiraceae bacterium]|nr:acyltransferase family protein [Lachnospiraceae bacterium]
MQKQFTKDRTNIVKGLAIIFLLIYHLFENENLVTSLGVNYSPFALSDFLMFTGFGNICVAVFVFLTGYGITKGLYAQGEISAKEAYRQATKRFFTLMGNFAVMYLSINLLWWSYFDYGSLYERGKQGVLHALTDMTGLSVFLDTPTLNMTWWYMELAYILIFLIPALAYLTKKVGYPVILLALFAPGVMSMGEDLTRYLFTAVLGVAAAYGNWPDKLLNLKWNSIVRWIVGIVVLVLSILIRQNAAVKISYLHLIDAPIALVLVYVGAVLLASVPFVNKVLEFIGKHSMNIYLVHTFFYMMLWQKFIYQFKYAPLILVVLLVVCLLYSVVLELVKKGVRILYKRIRKK